MKSVQIRSFSSPYFPIFGLNTEIYEVNLTKRFIQSNCGKNDLRRDLSSPNVGKYGPEKLRIWTLLAQCWQFNLFFLGRSEESYFHFLKHVLVIVRHRALSDKYFLIFWYFAVFHNSKI